VALIKCPECASEISDRADACPRCGCPADLWRPGPPSEPPATVTPPVAVTAGSQQGVRIVAAFVLLGVAAFIFTNLFATSSPPSRTLDDIPVADLDYEVIRKTVHNMRSDALADYRKTLLGKRIIWSGYVDSVAAAEHGASRVAIDMDPPSEEFSVADIHFVVPSDSAASLVKDEKIEFTGVITFMDSSLLGSNCSLRLDPAAITRELASPPSPAPHATHHVVDLMATVRFDGTRFTISNRDAFAWHDVELEINGGLFTGGYKLSVPVIEAGRTYSVGALQFAKSDGTRFNPFQTKPTKLSISCQTGSGDHGFYVGGW
jgi:hypothetical protein